MHGAHDRRSIHLAHHFGPLRVSRARRRRRDKSQPSLSLIATDDESAHAAHEDLGRLQPTETQLRHCSAFECPALRS